MTKGLKFVVAALAFAMTAGFAQPAAAEKPDAPRVIDGATTVDADGVIDLVAVNPDLVILDNRKERDFTAGHIESAIRLINTEVTPETLAARIPTKATPVMMYCNDIKCGRAAKAVEAALEAGYTNVFYYALGMNDWREKGLPMVSGAACGLTS